jgi:hydroxymethylglutaryl-CoA reductase (NADPH)
MPTIPAVMLKQLYQRGSLRNTDQGWAFTMRNHLAPARLAGIHLTVDGVPILEARVTVAQGATAPPQAAAAMNAETPFSFGVGVDTVVAVAGPPLAPGPHALSIQADTREIGPVTIAVQDTIAG